jgi:ferredoxin-thioredoxin reductase catalytic subunit
MEVDQLYEMLKKTQEQKGYLFNRDTEKVLDILKDLLVNKDRYGYMSCPCRLASGEREQDKDIVCPCAYRAADVEEYGSCYCSLYVSQAWNENKIPHAYVPERRPPEKMSFL